MLRHIDRILTGHGIRYQKDFSGIDFFLDDHQLIHQGFIHMKSSRCIENQDIRPLCSGPGHCI